MSLSRDRFPIRPLLAGQLRPVRTPPRTARPNQRSNEPAQHALRISYGSRSDSTDAVQKVELNSPAGCHPEAVDVALTIADESLQRIQSLLIELDDIWGRVGAALEDSVVQGVCDAASRPIATAGLGISDADVLQSEIEQRLDAINQDAASATYENVALFDGAWTVSVQSECESTGVCQLRLPRVAAETLGSEQIAGRIVDLRTGHDCAVALGNAASARAILRSALFQVVGYRERVAEFRRDVLASAMAAAGIASEMASAADAAIFDIDFIGRAGAVTRVDALIAGKMNGSGSDFLSYF